MSVYKKKRRDGTTAWYYDFAHKKVRRRGVGGATKTQALRTLEMVRSKVLSGEYELENRVNNPRIEDFCETFLNRRTHLRSHKRDKIFVKHLSGFFKRKVLSQIRAPGIEDYIAKRRLDGVTNATINRELACLKRMYNLAIKWGDANKNPVLDVDFLEESPGRTRFLKVTECQKLLSFCQEHLKPIVLTALNTGMRLEEILSLQWEQVRIDSVIDPYIEVITSKNNKKRFVFLNDDMVELLRRLKGKKLESEFVFLGTRGKRLFSVRNIFEKALAKAGITDFKFHDLRHTFASHFVMQGGDLLSLKEILGHSSMKMAERYTHLASAHKRKQINNLRGMFSECHPTATSANVAKIGGGVSSK